MNGWTARRIPPCHAQTPGIRRANVARHAQASRRPWKSLIEGGEKERREEKDRRPRRTRQKARTVDQRKENGRRNGNVDISKIKRRRNVEVSLLIACKNI